MAPSHRATCSPATWSRWESRVWAASATWSSTRKLRGVGPEPAPQLQRGLGLRFPGKVALISGAGAGIGRATASIIGREGGAVVAIDVDQAALQRLAAEVDGSRMLGIRADALDAAAVEDAVRRAVAAHGRIDVLVNAVGGSTVIPRPAATLDELSL